MVLPLTSQSQQQKTLKENATKTQFPWPIGISEKTPRCGKQVNMHYRFRVENMGRITHREKMRHGKETAPFRRVSIYHSMNHKVLIDKLLNI